MRLASIFNTAIISIIPSNLIDDFSKKIIKNESFWSKSPTYFLEARKHSSPEQEQEEKEHQYERFDQEGIFSSSYDIGVTSGYGGLECKFTFCAVGTTPPYSEQFAIAWSACQLYQALPRMSTSTIRLLVSSIMRQHGRK